MPKPTPRTQPTLAPTQVLEVSMASIPAMYDAGLHVCGSCSLRNYPDTPHRWFHVTTHQGCRQYRLCRLCGDHNGSEVCTIVNHRPVRPEAS